MDRRRADEIAEVLEQRILDGTFADGDRLDEVRLALQFGVSRTPLREALQRLSTSGLVQQLPRRGVFVRQLGPLEIVERFEVMGELEAACGRLAALRLKDEAILDLQEANVQCRDAAQRKDTDCFYSHNERFHHIIYGQCGNSFLEQETKNLHRRLKPYRRMQLRLRGRMAQSLDEHEKITEALAVGDSERAAAALRAHVSVQGEKFHHLISSLQSSAGLESESGRGMPA